MSASPTSGLRRHSASHPCRVCGGHDRVRRGTGDRCFGFLASDGLYEHCTREEFAGELIPGKDGCYAHRLNGDCKCGQVHGPALAHLPPPFGGGKGKGKPGRKLGPVVASYDYRTADGVAIFQVRRHQDGASKSFVQYHPTPGGGWAPGRGDAPLVPYRLPELLAAPPEAPVYIPEGEKCVELLRNLGQVATCNPGGAEKWRDEFAPHLAGRHVVVLRDNDPLHPKLGYRVGWKHAEDVARSVAPHAASVKVIDLAEGCKLLGLDDLPEKGDVVDFVAQGGTVEDLEWLSDRAPVWSAGEAGDEAGAGAEPWDEPWLDAAAAPRPFPVHVFPPPLARLIESIARCTCAPVDYPAVAALGAASSLIGRSLAIQIKESWSESAAIYALIIGERSEAKSLPMKKALAPIFAIRTALKAEFRDRKMAYDEALKAFRLESRAKGNGKAALHSEPDDLGHPRRIVAGNATVEKLAVLMDRSPRGLLLYHDELSAWFEGMNQYKAGGKGNDVQFFLGTWSGMPVMVDRMNQEHGPIDIAEPFLSIVGGIQPAVLAALEHTRRQDGLMERFLFSHPAPSRRRFVEESISREGMAAWVEAGQRLWDRQPVEGPDGEDHPRQVPLSPGAKAAFVAWHDATCEETEEADFPPALKGAWMKYLSYCARFALILDGLAWAFDPTAPADPAPISAGAMAGAIELAEYFKENFERARGSWRGGEPTPDEHADAVLKWVRGGDGRPARAGFTEKELGDNFKRRFRGDRAALARTLNWLRDRHCLRPVAAEPTGGRPASPAWEVNPALLSPPPEDSPETLCAAKAPAETAKAPPVPSDLRPY